MEGNNKTLTFGLDIGIASVGWAVLCDTRIINLGVRCFDKAETADKGESLNLARRSARLMRRRLRRRAWRLTKLARLLKREGLIPDINTLKQQPVKGFKTPNLWKLRVEALDHKLGDEEWARVIYHLCKHRGFHWISRAEAKAADRDSEGGKVKKGLAGTKKLMQEKNYRSAAEMVIHEFPDAHRNKQGDYGKALSRELLADELKLLFQRQRELDNPHATAELMATILGAGDKKCGMFWSQKPALSGEALLKMLGRCTFEKTEYRAPKASFTAERHVWLTRLNNLRIVVDGKLRPLTEAERQIALPLPYNQAGDFKYKQLRNALAKAGLSDEFRFARLAYPSERQLKEERAKDPEDERLIKLPAWQELRRTLADADLKDEWQHISVAALDGKPQLLDQIAVVLSVYKEDEEVLRELGKLDLPNKGKLADALLDIRFDKFSNLSLKALYKIVPLMEKGQRYDEAVVNIPEYGHHSQLHKAGEGEHKYLPPFYSGRGKDGRLKFNEELDIPRNPVVLRALNQARKVINALIREYGPPHEVHIEMARDLSRPLDERRDIEKAQKEFRDRNEKDKAAFASDFNIVGAVKGRDFEKYQLYREQQGKCAYSIEPLDINRLFEQSYVEIDHALPYSRSFDDSKNNRVLVLVRENRNKGNMTPYEYLDGKNTSERWQQFEAFVNGNKTYRQAKRNRLLKKDFGEKEARDFLDRNLNDTRYICRFFKNYVERYLKLHDESDAKRCVVLSGQMTAFLRARWGLTKVRSHSDRHHALDAVVVAACSHSMVKRLSDYSRRKELEKVREGFVDAENGEIVSPAMFERLELHFPSPWPFFRDELLARLSIDDPAALRAEIERLGSYPGDALDTLRPLFVSRAPQRRGSGAIHQETIRSSKYIDQGISYVKVPLQRLKLSDLEKIVGATYSHNNALISLLRKRLEDHGGDGKKAFAEPVYKPSATGKAPIVRTVKLTTTQKGGMKLRGGVADLGEMHHVNIYRHKDRYLVEPAYIAQKETHIKKVELPKDAEFLFVLTKNDYVKVVIGNSGHEGYFVMYENDGRMTLRAHDQPRPDKEYFRKSITNASIIKKFHVDVLGNIYPTPPEKRRDLA